MHSRVFASFTSAIRGLFRTRLTRLAIFSIVVLGAALLARTLTGTPTLLAIVARLHHGSLPHKVWSIDSQGRRVRIKRGWPSVEVPEASPTLPPIDFEATENYLAGQNAPYWNGGFPAFFLRREGDCSLTAYSADAMSLSGQSLMPNYQDVLHAQARINTVADQWLNGCADSIAGQPSSYVALERTSGGSSYLALAVFYKLFSSKNAVTLYSVDDSFTSISSMGTLATPEQPGTLVSIDVSGDGKPDLVVLSNEPVLLGATLSVFPGNGDGTYGDRVDYATSLATTYFTVADVNGDNALDLVVIGSSTTGVFGAPSVQVFLNDGHGAFGAPIDGPPIIAPFLLSGVVGNFTADNNKDIVTNSGQVLVGDGQGHFTISQNMQFAGADNITAGDFNNDGKLDVALTTTDLVSPQDEDTILIYLGNGNGTFTFAQSYASIYGASDIGVSDLDGDGNLDIIVGLARPNVFASNLGTASYSYYLLGRGDGTFSGARAYLVDNNFFLSKGPYYDISDFNNDSKHDVITTTPNPSVFQGSLLDLLQGDGMGTFAQAGKVAITPLSASFETPRVVAADFDGDKNSDAAVGILTTLAQSGVAGKGTVAAFIGNGAGSFGSEMDTPIQAQPDQMVAANFDPDGKSDIVIGGVVTTDSRGSPASGALFYLGGNGDGTFKPAQTIANPVAPAAVAAADLNGDQKLDLIVADGGSPGADPAVAGSTMVYLGKGDGTFQPPFALDAPTFPTAVAIADINNDEHPDVVVAANPPDTGGMLNSTFYAFLGDGQGNFQMARTSTSDEVASSIALADLNGDGFPDLAMGSCCGFTHTEVWAGKGDGTFAAPITLPIGISSSVLTLLDLNGDTKPDLLLGTGSQIEVMLNDSGAGVPTPIRIASTPGATPTASVIATATATSIATPNPTATATPTGAAGKISLAPKSVHFPKTGIGVAPGNGSFLVKNVGKAPLVGQVGIPSSAQFSISSGGGPFNLAPTQSVKVEMTFTPNAAGAVNGTVPVASNDPKSQQLNEPLAGVGEAGKLAGPKQLRFAKTPAGSQVSRAITFTNKGKGVLEGTVPMFGSQSPFSVTVGAGHFSLMPGDTLTLTIQFAPTTGGTDNDTIVIAIDQPSTPATFELKVGGVAVASQSSPM
jgi:hypothetical protein